MTARPREYCDLVMKGGVTSGIVYPSAVLVLSDRYTFKNIGGTSAGAIAAAATAAASLGERRKELASPGRGNSEEMGMAGLRKAARWLRSEGFIYSLFQPADDARTAFRLVVRLATRPMGLHAVPSIVSAAVAIAPRAFLIPAAVFILIGWLVAGAAGMLLMVVPALICALPITAFAAVRRVAQAIRRNNLGLCSGMGMKRHRHGAWLRRSDASPALTEWLHALLQSLSGQPPSSPLLFEHLWSAPRYEEEPQTPRTLSLEMITTGVSHGEPRSLPFQNSSFWFLREDFERLFPADVVEWMVSQDQEPKHLGEKTFYRLPEEGALPVVVAMRMSLSFPLLVSAIPLYEPDYRRRSPSTAEPNTRGAETKPPKDALDVAESLTAGGWRGGDAPTAMRICWFSDGGISSNFPLHLFDSPLPRWPTFAINLVYPQSDQREKDAPDIFLPKGNNEGWQPRYRSISRASAFAEVSRFLFAIIGTMQNWRDLLQSRAPGHRDRIVHISLERHEGGLNLDMPQPRLDAIADKGKRAGLELVNHFSFNNHYWIRWRNVAGAVERFTIAFAKGAAPPISASYAEAHSSAWTGSPPPPSYAFTVEQQRDAQARLATMKDQGDLWEDTNPPLSERAPRPLPQLRIVPTF